MMKLPEVVQLEKGHVEFHLIVHHLFVVLLSDFFASDPLLGEFEITRIGRNGGG